MKLTISRVQQNPYYDPHKTNDGGGYDQPHFHIESDDGWIADAYDDSCGVFGEKFSIFIECDEKKYSYEYNGMETDEDGYPKECSDIPDTPEFTRILKIIEKETGLRGWPAFEECQPYEPLVYDRVCERWEYEYVYSNSTNNEDDDGIPEE